MNRNSKFIVVEGHYINVDQIVQFEWSGLQEYTTISFSNGFQIRVLTKPEKILEMIEGTKKTLNE